MAFENHCLKRVCNWEIVDKELISYSYFLGSNGGDRVIDFLQLLCIGGDKNDFFRFPPRSQRVYFPRQSGWGVWDAQYHLERFNCRFFPKVACRFERGFCETLEGAYWRKHPYQAGPGGVGKTDTGGN